MTRIRTTLAEGDPLAETYQTIAKVGEIPEGEGRSFEVDGRIIVVFLDGGRYYALDDACPHQGAPLCDGLVMDGTVTCTWHGWKFALEDGRWLDSPNSKVRVESHPVLVDGDEIRVRV